MRNLIRISSFFLAVFYLFVSMGFGLKAHYCHGDLSSISYITSIDHCDCGDLEKEMKCCSNKEQFFQFDEEIVLNSNKINLDLISTSEPLLEVYHHLEYDEIEIRPERVFLSQGPPLFIKHSSLILYA